jgi:hypothetical protein
LTSSRPDDEAGLLPSNKTFRFLCVGTAGDDGIDKLLSAYRDTFRRSDDACLVIKEAKAGRIASALADRRRRDDDEDAVAALGGDVGLIRERFGAIRRRFFLFLQVLLEVGERDPAAIRSDRTGAERPAAVGQVDARLRPLDEPRPRAQGSPSSFSVRGSRPLSP